MTTAALIRANPRVNAECSNLGIGWELVIPGEPRPAGPSPVPTRTPASAGSSSPSVRAQVEDCLSPWDGNHNGFEDQVRPGLNDEDSMQTHSTRFEETDRDGDGHVLIAMEYSANNAYGARIKTVATGLLDYRTCRVTVLDPGY